MLYERVDRGRRADHRRRHGAARTATSTPLAEQLRRAYADGIRAVAVVCLHSYRNPGARAGDRRARRARSASPQVSLSSEVSPLTKLVPRGDTTVVDAYLSPVLRRYVDAGGRPARRRAADVHAVQRRSGRGRSLPRQGRDPVRPGGRHRRHGADVGAGRVRPRHRFRHGRHLHRRLALRRRVRASVHHPGRRGPAARTDAGYPHGRRGRRFDPALRRQPLPGRPGLGGRRPGPGLLPPRWTADRHRRQRHARAASSRRISRPCSVPTATSRWMSTIVRRGPSPSWPPTSERQTGDDRTPEQVAEGFLRIAVANMANAVKKISVQKGHDVTRYALTTFGGAGGQHACAVADALGIRTVLVPPMAGVLSAFGIGLADTTAMREQSVESRLESAALARLAAVANYAGAAARAELARRGRPGRADPGRPPGASALRRHRHRRSRSTSATRTR